MQNEVPAPLADAEVIGTAKSDANGSCDFSVKADNAAKNKYFAVIAVPPNGSVLKALISYPIELGAKVE